MLTRLEDFCAWCKIKDKLSPHTIELSVMQLESNGLSASAIKSSLSAIQFYCKAINLTPVSQTAVDSAW